MVPHLLQDTSIAYLTRARLMDPALVRVANRIHQRGQAQATQLLEWLAQRGLSPHGHSHQRGDRLRRSDLERLSQLDGAALDLAFVKVMTARDRAGTKLAATEAREGSVPAIRQLAQQLLAEEQARTATLQTWRRAWSKPHPVGHRLQSASIRSAGPPPTGWRLTATAGKNRGEAIGALLDKAGRFPILVQHRKRLRFNPEDGGTPLSSPCRCREAERPRPSRSTNRHRR
jgi:hypothetical protein